MFQIEAADLVIRFENRYEDIYRLCREYITGDEREADITVSVTEEELNREIEKAHGLFSGKGYAESVVAYEKISNALPAFDAFVMHSSVVAVNGVAYAFAAASGTGKSTHTRYWKEVLGERLTVINGDKPIYRFGVTNRLRTGRSFDASYGLAQDDRKEELIAYGTPWCGKEGWQTKTYAPLKALCLLERGEKNDIYPVDAFENLGELMSHFHLTEGGQVDMPKLMELIDRMVITIPVYRLRCREDISAAETVIAYFGL